MLNKEIQSRLKSGNTCYHLVQDHFVFQFAILKYQDTQNCNFAVYLYGCKTWSVILREDYRLRVSVNRMLWKIFGPKRDWVVEWRRVHHKEFHDLYSKHYLGDQIKKNEVSQACMYG
jgi:hypothetical protein